MALLGSVSGLVSSFSVGPLTVTRRGPPTLNSFGEFVEGASTPVVLDPVSVHNVSGKDRENLPSAVRESEAIEVYTTVRMFAGNDGQAADVLSYRGRNWICSFVADYDLQGGVYISIFTLEDEVQP